MNVKVIKEEHGTALVEWQDNGSHRAFVPVAAVFDGTVADEELAHAIPYGVQWEEVLTIGVTVEHIAQGLRNAGIWTEADLRGKQPIAVSVLQGAYKLSLGVLLQAAHTYESSGG